MTLRGRLTDTRRFYSLDESDIKRRELGVVFDNLRVVGLGASASYQPTLGSTLNPLQILDVIKRIRHPPVKDILSGFEGCVKPGEMLCESSTVLILSETS